MSCLELARVDCRTAVGISRIRDRIGQACRTSVGIRHPLGAYGALPSAPPRPGAWGGPLEDPRKPSPATGARSEPASSPSTGLKAEVTPWAQIGHRDPAPAHIKGSACAAWVADPDLPARPPEETRPRARAPSASPGSRAEVKLSLGLRCRPGLLLHSRHGLRSTFVSFDENVGISAVACVVVVA